MDKIYTFADTKKAVDINSEEAEKIEERNYRRLITYLNLMYGEDLEIEECDTNE